MQAFIVIPCIDPMVGNLLLLCDRSATNSSLLYLQKNRLTNVIERAELFDNHSVSIKYKQSIG